MCRSPARSKMPLNKIQCGLSLGSAACLLTLMACVPVEQIVEEQETRILAPATERAEEVLHDSEAPELPVSSGALLPKERLLQSGILDIGEASAPLTLLVFTEHHCGYCKEFHNEHFLYLMSDFVDNGTLRIQFVHFPLHKYANSGVAAKGVLCAARQGKGLAFSTLLFERTFKDLESQLTYAKEMELDTDIFVQCMESQEEDTLLAEQQEWAMSLGIEYVPSFLLNGEKFVGLPYYADLRGRIEQALTKQL